MEETCSICVKRIEEATDRTALKGKKLSFAKESARNGCIGGALAYTKTVMQHFHLASLRFYVHLAALQSIAS